jgi:hypothetical protein
MPLFKIAAHPTLVQKALNSFEAHTEPQTLGSLTRTFAYTPSLRNFIRSGPAPSLAQVLGEALTRFVNSGPQA